MSKEIPKIPLPDGKPYLGDEKVARLYYGNRVGRVIDGPPWWPNFIPPAFSEEELWEIERYCAQMVKNVKELNEPLTPVERWRATREFRFGDLDRPYGMATTFNILPMRALDCFSDSLKPGIDVHWYPKLGVKAHLCFNAKFKMDCVNPYTFSYGDTELGGAAVAKFTEYTAPYWTQLYSDPEHVMDDIKTGKLHPLDPYHDGTYPAYLWMVRKLKEFMKKHGAYDYIPILGTACAMGALTMSLKDMIKLNKRNPELYAEVQKWGLNYPITFGRAMWDILDPDHDILWICDFPTYGNLEQAKPYLEQHKIIVKAIPQFLHMIGFDQTNAIEYMCQNGNISLGAIELATPLEFAKKVYQKYHKLYDTITNEQYSAAATETPERNVELTKANIDTGAGPGYFFGVPATDPWAKIENLEAIVKTYREYGKQKWDELKKKAGALEWPQAH